MNPQIDEYIAKAENWQKEMKALRSILLDCGLTEELKWRAPCYTFQKRNVVMIGTFKAYCTLSFFKGVLLNDSANILVSPGENSQSVKMAKFTAFQEILENEALLKAYVCEAIEIEKVGLQVIKKEKKEEYVEELVEMFEADPKFEEAFESLTPGRQRGYNMFFAAAKQSKTRITRIEKYIPRIFTGKGINDCTCGHSKKMPNCDGTHKYI